jgi:hypothetical protein
MTNRTLSRDHNLRILIASLRAGELSQGQISDIFHCSRSGVRIYLKCLGTLVETIYHGVLSPRTYRLTDDQQAIDAFLASLGEIKPSHTKGRKPRSMVDLLRRDPTRHIHTMDDDAPFRVPVSHERPRHPELHLAFWAGRMA